jgi:uncharacterized membrane protein
VTILNGEPLDPPTRSSGSSVHPSGVPGGDPVRPIANPVAQIMAILGLIFAFAFPPAGLVLSIIAKRMSKAAGDRSPFATWGIALGIVFTVLTVLFTILIIAVTAGSIWFGFNYCENGVGDGEFFGIPIQCQ